MKVIGGKYKLLKPLGEGGMGAVYLAEEQGPHGFTKQVAIKQLLTVPPQMAAMAEMLVRRFTDEARLMGMLNHPKLVQVIEFLEEGGERFIVMEYVRGASVRGLCDFARTPLTSDIVAYIAAEVLKGLAYLHVARGSDGVPLGLVHRDISPQNILLSYEGEVKIADFGIAKAPRARWRKHTVGAPFIGNPEYAPEELTAQDSAVALDGRADLYSLGVVMYEMLTGANPFSGSTSVQAYVLQHEIKEGQRRVESPAMHNTSVAPALAEVVLRAMAIDRQRRFANADEMLAALVRAQPTHFTGYAGLRRLLGEMEGRSGNGVVLTASSEERTLKHDDGDGPAPMMAPPAAPDRREVRTTPEPRRALEAATTAPFSPRRAAVAASSASSASGTSGRLAASETLLLDGTPPRRGRRRLAIGAAAGLALVGAGAFALWRLAPRPRADAPAANAASANATVVNTAVANTAAANMPAVNMPVANMPATNVRVANMPATNVHVANIPAAHIPAANMQPMTKPVADRRPANASPLAAPADAPALTVAANARALPPTAAKPADNAANTDHAAAVKSAAPVAAPSGAGDGHSRTKHHDTARTSTLHGDGMARLVVSSRRAKLEVYVDGYHIGLRAEGYALAPGRHTVLVRDALNGEETLETFAVRAGAVRQIEF